MSTPSLTLNSLTRREHEVVALLARGHTNQEIAEALVISAHTVRSHIANVSMRLGIRGRTRLSGLVHQEEAEAAMSNRDEERLLEAMRILSERIAALTETLEAFTAALERGA